MLTFSFSSPWPRWTCLSKSLCLNVSVPGDNWQGWGLGGVVKSSLMKYYYYSLFKKRNIDIYIFTIKNTHFFFNEVELYFMFYKKHLPKKEKGTLKLLT